MVEPPVVTVEKRPEVVIAELELAPDEADPPVVVGVTPGVN